LKKYSKVSFLNENYVPASLTEIDKAYVLSGASNIQFLTGAYSYLEHMIRKAQREGIMLKVASAYRSFSTQSSLKSSYKVTYGSGANAFSADQGYSEHQLGTTVDFTTDKLGANFAGFAKDPAYTWLLNNAHRYGFVLSYPDKNAYYVFEPWHWRYVGVALATRLHDENKYFYDLDQREIDTYLVTLFD
jgi:zinc D-Ala-D-Ala carboxypeptidase